MKLSEMAAEYYAAKRVMEEMEKMASEQLGAEVFFMSETWVTVNKPLDGMEIDTVKLDGKCFDSGAIEIDGVNVNYFSDYRSEP